MLDSRYEGRVAAMRRVVDAGGKLDPINAERLYAANAQCLTHLDLILKRHEAYPDFVRVDGEARPS